MIQQILMVAGDYIYIYIYIYIWQKVRYYNTEDVVTLLGKGNEMKTTTTTTTTTKMTTIHYYILITIAVISSTYAPSRSQRRRASLTMAVDATRGSSC